MVADWCRTHAALVSVRKLWLFDNRIGDAGAAALAHLMSADMLEVTNILGTPGHVWVGVPVQQPFGEAQMHSRCWCDVFLSWCTRLHAGIFLILRCLLRNCSADSPPFTAGAPVAQQHRRRRRGRHNGGNPSATAARLPDTVARCHATSGVASSAGTVTTAARSGDRGLQAAPAKAALAANGVEPHRSGRPGGDLGWREAASRPRGRHPEQAGRRVARARAEPRLQWCDAGPYRCRCRHSAISQRDDSAGPLGQLREPIASMWFHFIRHQDTA